MWDSEGMPLSIELERRSHFSHQPWHGPPGPHITTIVRSPTLRSLLRISSAREYMMK